MSYFSIQAKKYVLLIGDMATLYLSLYLTLILRYGYASISNQWQQHLLPFTALFMLWVIIFYISNLYDLTLAINNAKFHARTAYALFSSFLLGSAFFYLIPNLGIAPKRNLLIDIIITAVLFLLWRRLFNALLKSYLPKNKVAIIGLNQQVKELIKYFHDHPHLGFRIAFIVYDQEVYEEGLYNVRVVRDIDKIKERLVSKNVSTVVLADDVQTSDTLRSYLFDCIHLGIDFINLPNFYEKITGKVPVKSINQMWFLENLQEGGKLWFDKLKRSYDLLIAFFILLITLPAWPLIAFIIKLESSGPIFYRQKRIGKNNRLIYLIKFRSMIDDDSNSLRPTVPHDSRITRLGHFIRRTRIDEIPQVLNIIKGDMSIIGPRPERPELAQQLQGEIPFYNERTLVLPGLTGWDQVCGEYHSPSREDTIKKLQYDLFYIKNRSVFLDLIIMLKTLRTVLVGRGM